IWIGNDRQDQPMIYKGLNIGSSTAAELWGSYMKTVTRNLPISDYPEPPGIVWARIDPGTGQVVPNWSGGETYLEVFNENNVPQSPMRKFWRWFFPGRKTVNSPTEGSREELEPENDQSLFTDEFEQF